MIRSAMIVLMIGLFVWNAGLGAKKPAKQDDTSHYLVSLIRVIANPNEFDGQRLLILGYLNYSYPDTGVGAYVSEVDGRNEITPNSIDLHGDDKKLEGLVGKYVLFSGIYHAPSPRAAYNGYFDQITESEQWNPSK